MVGQVSSAGALADGVVVKQATAVVEGFTDALAAVGGGDGAPTTAKSTGAAWQPPWMAGASAANQYLLPVTTPVDELGAGKPTLAAFMQVTGGDVSSSVEALYGSIGANKDYRDWTKIMASSDPLLAARQASQALYNSADIDFAPASAKQADSLNTVASAGNFAYLDQDGQKGLYVVDGQGRLLRNVNMDAPSILRAAESFGLDLAPLADLADQLDEAGVAYAPGKVFTGSNAGVDLKDLAGGGLGAAYDWRVDPNVGRKGSGAAAAQAADSALASRVGLTQNLMVTPPDLASVPSPATPTPTPTAPDESWAAPWMEGLAEADQYLLPAETPATDLAAARPTLATFMSETGASREESVEAIYGSIGSNKDYRDWSKIMAADDPLTAARQAAHALYNSDLDYAPVTAVHPDPADIIAQSGNFAWLDMGGKQGLYIVDSNNAILRSVTFDAPSILRVSRTFGLDLAELDGLADQMDAAGVAYLPHRQFANSDAGVDLRDLASGGLGAAYDWRQDANAAKKGTTATASLTSDRALAGSLGLTENLMVTPPTLTAQSSIQAAQAAASFAALLQLSQASTQEDAA
jgi:hypothetical protein